jgi:hypothetical protein
VKHAKMVILVQLRIVKVLMTVVVLIQKKVGLMLLVKVNVQMNVHKVFAKLIINVILLLKLIVLADSIKIYQILQIVVYLVKILVVKNAHQMEHV